MWGRRKPAGGGRRGCRRAAGKKGYMRFLVDLALALLLSSLSFRAPDLSDTHTPLHQSPALEHPLRRSTLDAQSSATASAYSYTHSFAPSRYLLSNLPYRSLTIRLLNTYSIQLCPASPQSLRLYASALPLPASSLPRHAMPCNDPVRPRGRRSGWHPLSPGLAVPDR